MLESALAGKGLRGEFHVLHVNHGVRGAEAERDAGFVAALAAGAGLPFHLTRLDPDRLMRSGRASEGRMREARYQAFLAAAARQRLDALYLAHHRGDRVESIVLSALRGAGLAGLRGMPRRRRLAATAVQAALAPGAAPFLVRPYFDVAAETLRRDLAARGRAFMTDSTNSDTTYTRNAVRLLFLPRLRAELGADLDERLLRLGRLARLLVRRARRGEGDRSEVIQQRLVELAAGRVGRAVSRRIQRASSGIFTLGGGTRVILRRDAPGGGARLERADLSGTGAARAPGALRTREFAWRPGRVDRLLRRLRGLAPQRRRALCEGRGRYFLDADRAPPPHAVRARRPGDRYRPLGLPAPSKVKSLALARGIPRPRRDLLPVLTAAGGRIVAVEGLPPAADCVLRRDSRRVLLVRLVGQAAAGDAAE